MWLYTGPVTHQRFRPVAHRLRMLVCMVDVPLRGGRFPALFGFDRFGLLGFRQKDHGDGGGDLFEWARRLLDEAGIAGVTEISVLCMPRVLGYAFNPLAVFFCRDGAGALRALIHQVNNTFGERHFYVLPVAPGADGVVRQVAAKAFHVSPFMDMDMAYRFTVRPPRAGAGARCGVTIEAGDAAGPWLMAAFVGRGEALTNGAVARAALAAPLQGLQVLGGIHWHALKLWLKGLRLRPAPPPREKLWST